MKYLLLILILTGCGAFPGQKAQEPEVFTIAVWNVHNLFDGQETENKYAEFRESSGWTQEKYQARITSISQAVLKMVLEENESSSKVMLPSVIGFVEVENTGVLEDLGGALSKYGYAWTAFTALPGSALGIGVLSRFPIKEAIAHSITTEKQTTPRPVLELRVEPRGKPIVFLLCHWKSKLGNDTEVLRRASARVVQRRLRELKEAEAETPVIVMGDLNENHDEFYRQAGLCALLPGDPVALVQMDSFDARDFLFLSTEKPPRSYMEIPALYSPWEDMEGGSYFYKGEWETIDHFLLSDGLFNGTGWNYIGCRVLDHEPFTTSGGVPNVYIPRNGRGLSDHLPLLLSLRDLPGD
ncbi:MAG: endonuclease/exonuclease/phosphatase family protein [Treponema sp.]|jgi:exonuclease III|nr:endonuclease/exonuclease/phosphatase family protein [Treponema sp.]